jgi:serine/threonine protein kinase
MHPRYKAERSLGEGGFDRVWLAEDTQTGLRVAVNELHKADPDHLRRLDREARILQSLQGDPFVVRLLGYDLVGSRGTRCAVQSARMANSRAEQQLRSRKGTFVRRRTCGIGGNIVVR